MRPVTIHHIELSHTSPHLSGGEKALIELVRSLRQYPHVRQIITTSESGERLYRKLLGADIEGVSFVVVGGVWIERISEYLAYYVRVVQQFFFLRQLSGESDHVLFAHEEFMPSAFHAFFLKILNPHVPWIVFFHMRAPGIMRGFMGEYTGKFRPTFRALRYKVEQWIFFALSRGRVESVVTVNSYYEDYLRGIYPRANIIALDHYAGARIEQTERVEPVHDLVFMGRFHEQKGVYEIVDILRRLREKKPNISIIMIGGGVARVERKFKKLLREHGLERHVHFAGYIVDSAKYQIMERARVFLFPSYYESFGQVALEAMACGLPVVAYDLPPFGVFERGMIRVPVLGNETMTEAILQLLTDREHYDACVRDAREFSSGFSWERTSQEIVEKVLAKYISLPYVGEDRWGTPVTETPTDSPYNRGKTSSPDDDSVRPLTIHHIELSHTSPNLSGGEKAMVEIIRYIGRFPHVRQTITTSESGANLYKKLLATDGERVSYVIVGGIWIERINEYLTYYLRIFQQVFFVRWWHGEERGGQHVIFTHEEFMPTVLHTFCLRVFNPYARWIGFFHMRAPDMFRGFEGEYTGRRKSLPDIRIIRYRFEQYLFFMISRGRADLIITVSPFYERLLRPIYPSGRPKLRCVERFSGIAVSPSEDIPPAKDFDLVFMGRFHEQKGVLEIIDILLRLREHRPDVNIAMIGGGVERIERRFQELVREHGLARHVQFFGYVVDDTKYDILRRARVFIMPSYYESFGLVALEAMACGLPVVAYDLPPFEVFERGMIRVPILDNEKMTEAILRLLTDTDYYEDRVREARAFAGEYSWERTGADVWAMIQETIQNQ